MREAVEVTSPDFSEPAPCGEFTYVESYLHLDSVSLCMPALFIDPDAGL